MANKAGLTSASMAIKRLSADRTKVKSYYHHQPIAPTSCCIERDAALIIDIDGRINCCSPAAAELLGSGSEILRGNTVAAVIPGLPFTPNTPEYNIAYAIFHGADDLWVRHTALSVDGRKIPIDVAFVGVMNNGGAFIVLTIKPVEEDYQRLA
ncbi:hypothetical protein CCP3SC15_720002 [Gammaproteobacteria bacterium]